MGSKFSKINHGMIYIISQVDLIHSKCRVQGKNKCETALNQGVILLKKEFNFKNL